MPILHFSIKKKQIIFKGAYHSECCCTARKSGPCISFSMSENNSFVHYYMNLYTTLLYQGITATVKLITSECLLSWKTSVLPSHDWWKYAWTRKMGYALNCVGHSTPSHKYSYEIWAFPTQINEISSKQSRQSIKTFSLF